MPISRGFHGRRRSESEPERVPPGQYVTDDFPVLSAGPTPHRPLEEWSFTVGGAVDEPLTWSVGRVRRTAERDRHRRHPLRDEVVEARHGLDGRLARHAARRHRDERRVRARIQRRRLHDEPAARGSARRQGLDRLRASTTSRSIPSTAARPGCSCLTSISGRARSGCAGSSFATTTSPASGRATATTTTATHGKSSATRATELEAGARRRAPRRDRARSKASCSSRRSGRATAPASTSTCG